MISRRGTRGQGMGAGVWVCRETGGWGRSLETREVEVPKTHFGNENGQKYTTTQTPNILPQT